MDIKIWKLMLEFTAMYSVLDILIFSPQLWYYSLNLFSINSISNISCANTSWLFLQHFSQVNIEQQWRQCTVCYRLFKEHMGCFLVLYIFYCPHIIPLWPLWDYEIINIVLLQNSQSIPRESYTFSIFHMFSFSLLLLFSSLPLAMNKPFIYP